MAKLKKNEPLPLRPSSHIKEDDSKSIFMDAITPWMFQGATNREYGIDGFVEITQAPSYSEDQIVTGKRFSIQLKSSKSSKFRKDFFSLSIDVQKINYWRNSIEPIMLVYVDLNSEVCYYRWIDDNLVQELNNKNPNWIAQQTISIRFVKNKTINAKSLIDIQKYVHAWKRPSKTVLNAGSYFKYSNEATLLINSLSDSVKEHKVNFLSQQLDELIKTTKQSIYTIAVVGPNKAGKSTLINTLIQKDISPIGRLPTTGIPITIFPSSENKAIVTFKNDKKIEGKANSIFLREYTTKDENPDNEKNVKIVSVQVVNPVLERGLAICDVPGLDDPDEEIRKITKTALFNVNAIVYLISAGSYASGDFSINNQIIKDLSSLSGRMDRIFLVFNKIDALSSNELVELKEYVSRTLKRHNVLDYLASDPIYISAKLSYECRLENQRDSKNDSVKELESQIWEYLLSNNKTGLHNILGSFADCLKLIEQMRTIINARMVSSDKREHLEKEIHIISSEIKGVNKLVRKKQKQIYLTLEEFLINSLNGLLDYLYKDLSSYPLHKPIPQNKDITKWLEDNAFKTISDTYRYLDEYIYDLQSTINSWISKKLKQVEIGIESPENIISTQMPEITRFTNLISVHYYDKKKGYLGILESFFGGVATTIESVFTAIGNIFTSEEKKRKQQINNILKNSKRSFDNIAKDCLLNLNKHLLSKCNFMEEKSLDRARVYLGELSEQLKDLDKPISKSEKKNYNCFIEKVSKLELEIQSNLSNLKDYTNWIDDDIN